MVLSPLSSMREDPRVCLNSPLSKSWPLAPREPWLTWLTLASLLRGTWALGLRGSQVPSLTLGVGDTSFLPSQSLGPATNPF